MTAFSRTNLHLSTVLSAYSVTSMNGLRGKVYYDGSSMSYTVPVNGPVNLSLFFGKFTSSPRTLEQPVVSLPIQVPSNTLPITGFSFILTGGAGGGGGGGGSAGGYGGGDGGGAGGGAIVFGTPIIPYTPTALSSVGITFPTGGNGGGGGDYGTFGGNDGSGGSAGGSAIVRANGVSYTAGGGSGGSGGSGGKYNGQGGNGSGGSGGIVSPSQSGSNGTDAFNSRGGSVGGGNGGGGGFPGNGGNDGTSGTSGSILILWYFT